MTSTRIAIAVSLAAVLAACSGSRSEQRSDRNAAAAQGASPAQDRSAARMQGMSDICPMDVPETKVTANDTATGEALTFTTTSGQVDELRRRVHAMADLHNQHMAREAATQSGTAQQGTGAGESQDMKGHHGGHGMMPGSHASVEDVDSGARVNVVPDDPAQADRVRTMVSRYADHMQSQGCGMMHGR